MRPVTPFMAMRIVRIPIRVAQGKEVRSQKTEVRSKESGDRSR
jgi:hypothetical protein